MAHSFPFRPLSITQLFGLALGLVVDVFYLVSTLASLRLIFKCAYTEPGVVPSVPGDRAKELRELVSSGDGFRK